jgi:hypothetical protein
MVDTQPGSTALVSTVGRAERAAWQVLRDIKFKIFNSWFNLLALSLALAALGARRHRVEPLSRLRGVTAAPILMAVKRT